MAAGVSIKNYAKQLNMEADVLLSRLRDAGINKSSPDDEISIKDKLRLREHMAKRFGKGGKSSMDSKQARARTVMREEDGVLVKRRVSAEEDNPTAQNSVQNKQPIAQVGVPIDMHAKVVSAEAELNVEPVEPQAAVTAPVQTPAQANTVAVEKTAPTTSKKTFSKKDRKFEGMAKRDQGYHDRSSRSKKKRKKPLREVPSTLEQEFAKPTQPIVREVMLAPGAITIADLAQKMSVKGVEVIKAMMGMGMMMTINQSVDQETAAIVVEEMGHKAKIVHENAREIAFLDEFNAIAGETVKRAPVVTIMGHVDHGKTSLLDTIRTSKVTSGEAGGITQHIGAYHVSMERGSITFLDTPGHEAFTAMRARGTQVTDIVILVVAADDGVKPQTVEAIQHARAAEVPIVVAINKIDKPEIDLERVRSELAQHEVVSEDWGGDTIFQPISAKTGQGIDDLLDSVLLQSEVLELKAKLTGPGRGRVIESRLDRGRGPVATVLVTAGTVTKGDILLAGTQFGRVRAMIGDHGQQCQDAGPSIPVEVLGLSGVPAVGDEVFCVADERKAREMASFRQTRQREDRMARQRTMKMERIKDQFGKDEQVCLNVVLKADVLGSLEAIVSALEKLTTDAVRVSIVSSGVGALTESDANLAMASSAVMIGFNVRADATSRQMAQREGIDLRYYSVIYDLIDAIRAAMTGLLAPTFEEKIVGIAKVREVFRSSKLGAIAGCLVEEGAVKSKNPIRVLRQNVVIYEGALESLRRHKDDVNEVKSGTECGIGVKNYNDVQVGDQIEVYEVVEVRPQL